MLLRPRAANETNIEVVILIFFRLYSREAVRNLLEDIGIQRTLFCYIKLEISKNECS